MRPIRIARLPLVITTPWPWPPPGSRACSGAARCHTLTPSYATKAPAAYYVALGDSLAQGVQPNAAAPASRPPTATPTRSTPPCTAATPPSA